MTYEEARNVIECLITNIEGAKLTYDALEKAEEALEKQIPKIPNVEEDSNFKNGKCFYCPTCGSGLYTNADDDDYNYWVACCDICGQAIDYGDMLI